MMHKKFWTRSFEVHSPGLDLTIQDIFIAPGETLLVQAPSGFGKTTLIRGLAGFEKVIGSYGVGDQAFEALAPHEKNIGVLFQDQLLFSHLNALENVAVGLRLRGETLSSARQKSLEGLISLGLESRARAPVTELSGGERQRVAMLRSLIFLPQLLILDEPFKGLDEKSLEQMRQYLRTFLEKHPTPVILISHVEDSKEPSPLKLVGEWNASSGTGERNHEGSNVTRHFRFERSGSVSSSS